MKSIKRTNEEIHQEALKYKTRGEFCKFSPQAYQVARRRGILDKVCSHMPKHIGFAGKNNPRYKWTFEMLHNEALKYNTRGEFHKNSRTAYNTAYRRGILNKICSHMPICSRISKPESELFDFIKNIYPNIKKLVDKKVNIQNMPYVKWLEIDIYNEEYKKGIEFDGTFSHSTKGLKRGREKWSDEQINNYHEIKDTWFLTKGIKILHIKQEDWNIDKQACIEKCLVFLKN